MKTLLYILLLILVAGGAYYFGMKYKIVPAEPAMVTATPVLSPTEGMITTSPGAPSTPSATATVDETAVLIAAVKQGLVVEHGPDANSLNVTVSTIQNGYAKGMASSQGGGGLWFAAKVGGVWKLVWDGNGIIDCTTLTPYPNFPTSMIPECFNSSTQKMVTR